jgi:hypothetical protein
MSQRAIGRLHEEHGSALVVAILVTVMLLTLGLGTLAFAEGQSRQGGNERIQESTFNLTEAALRQQLFLVSKSWPGSKTSAYPKCPRAPDTPSRCPDDSGLRASYSASDPDNKDYSAGYSWETRVQDNGNDGGTVEEYYTSDVASRQPGWDANLDGKVWVRASSTVRDRTRTMVTLVSARRVEISSFPRKVITGGHFATGNNGNKVIVNTEGTAQPSGVQVRCPSSTDTNCLDYRQDKGKQQKQENDKQQISPEIVTTGYAGGDAMTEDELNGLRGIAQQNGTYYASGEPCPDSLTGKVVFIESNNCSYNKGSFNSAETPGTVVIATGTLSLEGNASFFGLIYGANKQETDEDVVTLGGNACIQGAVAVDGDGGVRIGSSGNDKCGGFDGNLVWDPTAITQLETYGQATPEDGTWRELCVRQNDRADCAGP